MLENDDSFKLKALDIVSKNMLNRIDDYEAQAIAIHNPVASEVKMAARIVQAVGEKSSELVQEVDEKIVKPVRTVGGSTNDQSRVPENEVVDIILKVKSYLDSVPALLPITARTGDDLEDHLDPGTSRADQENQFTSVDSNQAEADHLVPEEVHEDHFLGPQQLYQGQPHQPAEGALGGQSHHSQYGAPVYRNREEVQAAWHQVCQVDLKVQVLIRFEFKDIAYLTIDLPADPVLTGVLDSHGSIVEMVGVSLTKNMRMK